MDALITSVTEGQKKQFKRFVEDTAERALKEVGLDKDSIQKLIERGDEFQSHIITGIREFSVNNQFADEEVKSSYGYLSGYKKPKGITVQTDRLRELFSGIGYADEKLVEQLLPASAEGWFAIPKWEKFASTYSKAVEKVLDMINKTRNNKFYNYYKDHCLRQHIKTIKMFQMISDQQKKHDILVVPAQFGLRHRGRSVRRAREVMSSSEFGLGAFAVGIMLLTHPERLQNYDDLWIDCAGDEFSSTAGGQFDNSPYFVFNSGILKFNSRRVVSVADGYGSASAFWQ